MVTTKLTWQTCVAPIEGAVKVTVHRLRRRFGCLVRAQIERTVASPDEIDDEIRDLFIALS